MCGCVWVWVCVRWREKLPVMFLTLGDSSTDSHYWEPCECNSEHICEEERTQVKVAVSNMIV